MSKKRLKIISTILVILFSFLFHSIYDKFPNFITSLFFPVNESIWEHMKMVYLSYVAAYIIELVIIHKTNIHSFNQKASIVISILFNIVIYLAFYIPVYNIFGFNEFVTIFSYIISIIITEIVSYKVITSDKNYSFLNKYSYLILFIIELIFIYLTYFPLKLDIFVDELNKKTGISNLY